LLTCLFRWTKALLALDHGDRELTWTLVTFRAFALAADDPVDPAQSGLHGLAGSMANEYPNWQIRAIDLEDEEHLEAQPLVGIVPGPHGFPLARRHGQWRVQRLANCQVIASSVPRYKAGGVYLVIGGAGGLGEMFSEHLIRTFRAQMVWLGRRPANEVIEAKLDRLAALGPRPHYVVADAADEQGLRAAYAEVRRRFGRVDGVVHSAVGDLDSSLATMTEESFRSVLSAKIDVCVQIDRVLCQEALDFVIFFSSMVSFTRDHGKSGYAAGSLFKDAFAHELARRVPGAVKVMNWGWLGQVGIANAIPDAARKRLERQGVRAISPDEAMDALSRLLASPLQQLGCISETKDAAFLLGSLSAQASLVLPSMKSSFLGGLVERLDNLSSHGAEMSMN
jgi:NAD(P)-dependent dehydrogenase (short-subunit alcohol dehydrogenase family)